MWLRTCSILALLSRASNHASYSRVCPWDLYSSGPGGERPCLRPCLESTEIASGPPYPSITTHHPKQSSLQALKALVMPRPRIFMLQVVSSLPHTLLVPACELARLYSIHHPILKPVPLTVWYLSLGLTCRSGARYLFRLHWHSLGHHLIWLIC